MIAILGVLFGYRVSPIPAAGLEIRVPLPLVLDLYGLVSVLELRVLCALAKSLHQTTGPIVVHNCRYVIPDR